MAAVESVLLKPLQRTFMSLPTYAASIDSIRQAAERLAGHIHQTPLVSCQTIDARAGRELLLKCENQQKVGAFKFRGATNAVALLSDEQAAQGVVTHSSGNHAQALALAARNRGIAAHIVMPENAPSVKRQAVEGYGAEVILCQPTLSARETTAQDVVERTGAQFIHPYNNPHIIAGQGTCGLEILEEVPQLDGLIVPVGGGGLLSGICLAARAINPKIRIFAAEPAGADDAAQSLAAGELIPQTNPQTIADGLLTSLGDLTWPIIRDHVEAIITVEDEAIVEAMRLLWERAKLVVEPSGAVGVAAALSDTFQSIDGLNQVAVVLTGGNVNLDQLPW
jgi:threonine dehydratase/serine racemase